MDRDLEFDQGVLEDESGMGGARPPVRRVAAGEGGQPMSGGALPLAALFDELAFGMAIVDVDGRLVHASRAARMQLQSGRGLAINGNRVVADTPADEQALTRALVAATTGRRSYLAIGPAGSRMDIAVLPMQSQYVDGKPVMGLVFEKAPGSGGLSLYFFAQAYGLTRAEQSVLTELSDGASVVDAAHQIGSSVHTVRTHVRNILTKTGQPNLRGLTRRIGTLPPVGARFAVCHARGEGLAPRGGVPDADAVPGALKMRPVARDPAVTCRNVARPDSGFARDAR